MITSKPKDFYHWPNKMQRTHETLYECNIQTFYSQRSQRHMPPLRIYKCITAKRILILYSLLLTNAVIIFIKYFGNSSSRHEILDLSKRTPNIADGYQEACQEVFRIQENSAITKSNEALKFFSILNRQNNEESFIWYDFYYLLSKMIPHVVTDTVAKSSTYEIHKESRLDRMNWKIPYLPCRLREYSDADVYKCILNRSQTGKHFRITYVGDSRVRRPMEYLLELLHKFNLTITTYDGATLTLNQFFGDKGTMLWPKYKHKLTVRSSLLPTLQISYTWAPFLSRGDSENDEIPHLKYRQEKVLSSMFPRRKSNSYAGKDEYFIKTLKSNSTSGAALRYRMQAGKESGAFDELIRLNRKSKNEIPDIILIDTSAWLLPNREFQDMLHNIDKWAISGTFKLHKTVKELAAKTTVIVLLPSPFKDAFKFTKDEFSYFDLQSNRNQQWYLNAQIQMLPRNVIKWDSFIPVAFASNDDCYKIYAERINVTSLPKLHGFDNQNSYSCDSKIHSGYEAIGIAVQMLLNQICNVHMERHINRYCCES